LLIERSFAAGPTDPLLRKAVIGGVIHLASDWVARGYKEPEDRVTDSSLRLCSLLRMRSCHVDKDKRASDCHGQ
jgi:hypothetical protein